MKKIASFIVEKRFLVLAIVLAATVISVRFIPQVAVNTDMTKYLPDNSPMKQGIDVMDEEFPGLETTYTLRVMFTDLPDVQKEAVRDELEAIPQVDDVAYEPDDEDYNRDRHTLYVVSTLHDFNTPEELALETALTERYAEYNMVFLRDSENAADELPPRIILAALAILMVILFIMCGSWVEPFLFLVAIGVAVVINMGTNIILGTVSETTFAISAILQLVLSMDYSIILINRYRQELEEMPDKFAAMKAALVNAFSSIASSAVTTIVGLLVLVFMNFKIGKDIGVVLAKGVTLSMISVFTLLPVLILMCDKAIRKTAKKAPHIRMKALSRFSSRFGRAIAGFFVLLFIAAYTLQGNTETVFTLDKVDPIADVFPIANPVLVLFDNDDDQVITELAAHIEENEYVKSVASVSTTIGKPYTSAELADELDDLGEGSGMAIDGSVLDILYYYRYKNGETGDIPTGDFLRFIENDVVNNDTFEEHLDDDIRENLDMLSIFAEREELLAPKDIAEIAEIFEMDAEDLSNLFVYYYGKNGGVPTGTLTLPQFTGFLVNDILTDADFADLVDADVRDMVDQMKTVTDPAELQTPRAAVDAADTLEMDADDMELLYLYYFGKHGAADTLELTFPQFVRLLLDDVLNDARFADALDDDIRENVDKLAVFADPKRFQSAQTSAQTASALDMEPNMAELLYALYFAEQGAVDKTELTIPQFVRTMEDMLADENFQDAFDEETRDQIDILRTFGNEKQFTSDFSSRRFAGLLDIKQELSDFLFAFYAAGTEDIHHDMTVVEFLRFLTEDILQNRNFSSQFRGEQAAQIRMLATFTDAETLLTPYTSEQMARLLGGMGVDKAMIDAVYAMVHGMGPSPCLDCGGTGVVGADGDADACAACGGAGYIVGNGADTSGLTMTLSDFIDTLAAMGGSLPPESAGMVAMLQGLKDAALSGAVLPFQDMAGLIGMDAGTLGPLYVYHMHRTTNYTLPNAVLYDLVEYLSDNLAGSGVGGDDLTQLSILLDLMDAVLEEERYTANGLADLVDMESDTLKILFAYRETRAGRAAGWSVSLETLLDYVLEKLPEGEFGDALDEEDLDGLETARTLMGSTLSEQRYTPRRLAELIDMEELEPEMLRILYAYHIHRYGNTGAWLLTLPEMVDFILTELVDDVDFADTFDEEDLDGLETLRAIMAGTLTGTTYPAEELADLLDIDDPDLPRMLYLLRINRYGDTSGWRLPLRTFINYIHDDVLTDEDLAEYIDTADTDRLIAANRIVESVIEGAAYSVNEMAALFDGISEDLSADRLQLLYVYYFSRIDADPSWTFSLLDLFHYLLDDILQDPLFADVFDAETRQELLDAKADLDEAIELLAGPNYSRMVISTIYPGESDETFAFIANLIDTFDGSLGGSYYLIGGSPMNYEMAGSFQQEMNFITLLTAISIFIVIAVTFRSLSIPLILVLVIQCGVFITIGLIGAQGYDIHYLALLIVQCILMGSTIDYGILFTSYYVEKRRELPRDEALAAAYEGSSHTILTSGSIMILVTGIVGILFENPTIGEICQTISRGAMSATFLIVLILPGLLVTFDSWVAKPKKTATKKPTAAHSGKA